VDAFTVPRIEAQAAGCIEPCTTVQRVDDRCQRQRTELLAKATAIGAVDLTIFGRAMGAASN
jgi:hypothetical protein